MYEATLVFTPDGLGHGLYTEAIDLNKLGRLRIERATTIEFDNRKQVWQVRDVSGTVIFSSPSRTECLEWEHQVFSGRPYETIN